MDRYFDWRILAGVLALALVTATIAAVVTVRRRRAAGRARRIGRFRVAGEQARLARSAEALAAKRTVQGGGGAINAPAGACTCGLTADDLRGQWRAHRIGCPARTKEHTDAVVARWKTERGTFDPTPPRPMPPTWRDPGPELDLMEAAAASSREPEQLVVMAAHPGEHPVFLGSGGEFGGAGATGGYDFGQDMGTVYQVVDAPAPAPACEPAPAADTSSSYSYDPGPSSGGGSCE